MASVYSNAFCTIAASGQRDSTTGLLEPCVESTQYESITRPWREKDDKGTVTYHGNIIMTRYADYRGAFTGKFQTLGLEQELSASRWGTRGWVFQERLPSRRIIFFGQRQIYWECQSVRDSEDYYDGLTPLNQLAKHQAAYATGATQRHRSSRCQS